MLNFKHLHYFWVTAKQGSIVRAAENLHITPQTISGQIQILEQHIGKKLFYKQGRQLQLTDVGHTVLSYAEQIFALGTELEKRLSVAEHEYRSVLHIGIVDSLPKSVSTQLLLPLMKADPRYRLICREEPLENLVHELQMNRLDFILSDRTMDSRQWEKMQSVLLGSSHVSFVASSALVEEGVLDFPSCLQNLPMLLPAQGSILRQTFLKWIDEQQWHLNVVGEFDDSALMKAFGQAGVGVFMVPTDIVNEVMSQYQVMLLGQIDRIQYPYYLLSRMHASEAVNLATQSVIASAMYWLKNGE